MRRGAAYWIATNELRRLASDRAFLLFGLGLPVIIMVLVGSTFGTSGSIDLGVVDQDRSAASAQVIERLGDLDGVDLKRYGTESGLRKDVRTTARQAGLVLPAGYGEAVARGDARVGLVVDPTSAGAAGAIAAIQGAIAQEGVVEAATRVASEALEDPAAGRRRVAALAEDLAPVEVEQRTTGAGRSVEVGTFSYTAPSNLVLFVFINTFVVSALIALSRREGTIARMLATPNRASTILLGIGASRLLFSLAQSVIILAVGAIGFGVDWGDPLAAGLLVVIFAAVSTTIGLLVGSLVSDPEQAMGVGMPLAVAMGMLGGCMWPLDVVPDVMRIAGHVVPQAWAMDAWLLVIFDDGTVRDILPELAVLVGITAVLAPVSAWSLRRSIVD